MFFELVDGSYLSKDTSVRSSSSTLPKKKTINSQYFESLYFSIECTHELFHTENKSFCFNYHYRVSVDEVTLEILVEESVTRVKSLSLIHI